MLEGCKNSLLLGKLDFDGFNDGDLDWNNVSTCVGIVDGLEVGSTEMSNDGLLDESIVSISVGI